MYGDENRGKGKGQARCLTFKGLSAPAEGRGRRHRAMAGIEVGHRRHRVRPRLPQGGLPIAVDDRRSP